MFKSRMLRTIFKIIYLKQTIRQTGNSALDTGNRLKEKSPCHRCINDYPQKSCSTTFETSIQTRKPVVYRYATSYHKVLLIYLCSERVRSALTQRNEKTVKSYKIMNYNTRSTKVESRPVNYVAPIPSDPHRIRFR